MIRLVSFSIKNDTAEGGEAENENTLSYIALWGSLPALGFAILLHNLECVFRVFLFAVQSRTIEGGEPESEREARALCIRVRLLFAFAF